MNPTLAALALSIPLAALGLASGFLQVRGMRRLAARKHVPSDEFGYLRNRHRRRLLAAAVMLGIAGLIAGSYLSGMERAADAIGNRDKDAPRPPENQAADKAFARQYVVFWAVVIVLAFALIGIAVVDSWATRRYWLGQYRAMREEHDAQLRRDLAVYKQHKESRRGASGFGGRLGTGGPAE